VLELLEPGVVRSVVGVAEAPPPPIVTVGAWLLLGWISTPRKAVAPMCTVDDALPATICLASVAASSMGMEKA
jgi:hypothetical protein